MSSLPLVLTVDDDDFIHDVIQEALEDDCRVLAIRDGAAALAAFNTGQPDLVICDVEMPGVDGYNVCRQIRATDRGKQIPVLFLSGKDAIEDRLKGFEAGGDDYMTKPFKLPLLVAKVKNLLALAEQRSQLQESINCASNTAITAMASLGELGCLLHCLREINSCGDYQMLVDSILAGLAEFGLEGTVKVRTPDGPLLYTSKGPASPLDVSIITHMATMEKIVQFKSRLSINAQNVSILVTNLPVEDEDRSGRLRDHLAMMSDIATSRLDSIAAARTARSQVQQLSDAVTTIAHVVEQLNTDQRESRTATALTVAHVGEVIEKVIHEIPMSDAYEGKLKEAVRKGLDQIVESQNTSFSGQKKLSAFLSELQAELKWASNQGMD